MIKSRIKNQRGDTIVEVLIAAAVISMVLASSYAITNRNVAVNQDTQEHNQSQQIIQQQIERLRSLDTSDPSQLTNPFRCIVGSAGSLQTTTNASACSFVASGKTGNCTEEPCYDIRVNKNVASNIYTVIASWDSLRGGKSTTTMVYGL